MLALSWWFNCFAMFINFDNLGQKRKKKYVERGITESNFERKYLGNRFQRTSQ